MIAALLPLMWKYLPVPTWRLSYATPLPFEFVFIGPGLHFILRWTRGLYDKVVRDPKSNEFRFGTAHPPSTKMCRAFDAFIEFFQSSGSAVSTARTLLPENSVLYPGECWVPSSIRIKRLLTGGVVHTLSPLFGGLSGGRQPPIPLRQ
jgi:hypothetical protein